MTVTDPDSERILLNRVYEENVSTPTGTVAAAAAAIGEATEAILARFIEDLSRLDLTKTNRLRRAAR